MLELNTHQNGIILLPMKYYGASVFVKGILKVLHKIYSQPYLTGLQWLSESDGSMSNHQPNNPLHGVTLEMILTHLVDRYGWEELGRTINIKCFTHEPSIKSSLKFLRKTPWAREKVEGLYLRSLVLNGSTD